MRGLLLLIKGIHTAAFFVIAGSILVVFADGARGRPRRTTGVAAAIALSECAVFAANGFVCPLTPLAERYGAERGSVTDIFLPDVIARNLAWIATPILVVGLVLNGRALAHRRRGRQSDCGRSERGGRPDDRSGAIRSSWAPSLRKDRKARA